MFCVSRSLIGWGLYKIKLKGGGGGGGHVFCASRSLVAFATRNFVKQGVSIMFCHL